MVAMLWLFHDRTATKIVSEVGSKFLKKKIILEYLPNVSELSLSHWCEIVIVELLLNFDGLPLENQNTENNQQSHTVTQMLSQYSQFSAWIFLQCFPAELNTVKNVNLCWIDQHSLGYQTNLN